MNKKTIKQKLIDTNSRKVTRGKGVDGVAKNERGQIYGHSRRLNFV